MKIDRLLLPPQSAAGPTYVIRTKVRKMLPHIIAIARWVLILGGEDCSKLLFKIKMQNLLLHVTFLQKPHNNINGNYVSVEPPKNLFTFQH